MKTVELIHKPDIELVKLKRVAAYCRVSLDTDELCHSLNAQIEYFKKRIISTPQWKFAGVFYDEGISGTSTARPGFQALMTECRNGNIDIVLTKSISRFARNTLDLLETVRELKSKGTEIRFERENINSLSTDGELMLTLLASFAEEESHSVSENTKWAIKKKFEKGIECGAHTLYGYEKNRDGKYVIKDEEAEVVRKIFDDYLAGLSPHKIADKYKFPYTTVWQMLRQTKYMGDMILQKTISLFDKTHKSHTRKRNEGEEDKYYVENAIPAIISKEIFNAVRDKINSRLINGKIYKRSPLTSLVVCGECGRHYRRRNGSNGSRFYWKCSGKTEHNGCASLNVSEEFLEGILKKYGEQIEKIMVNKDKLNIKIKGGSCEQCNINTGNDKP